MKKLTLLLFSFFIFTTNLAQKINFPDCFKFDQSIFTGMVLAKINDEMRKEHIFENPAIVTDEMGIRRMAERMDSKNITQVYFEIYADDRGRGDAGVMVYEFNSVKNMEKVIPEIQDQSNYVVLTADRYLIQVWNDSRDTENRLRKSVDFYNKKVNAKKIVLKPFENSEVDSAAEVVDVATTEVVDEVGEVAPSQSF